MSITCNECGRVSHTDEDMTKWRFYPTHEEVLVKKYNVGCPDCVRRYAIRQSKERQRLERQKNSRVK
jgi:hypothetical protein